jgi:predicted nucleic acid-binding protein
LRPWVSQDLTATSVPVYAETLEALKGRPDFPDRHRAVKRLLKAVAPYTLNYRILERYADVRRALRPPYGPGLIGDIDTLIAVTALEFGLTVVTTDTDFQRVPGLDVLIVTLR